MYIVLQFVYERFKLLIFKLANSFNKRGSKTNVEQASNKANADDYPRPQLIRSKIKFPKEAEEREYAIHCDSFVRLAVIYMPLGINKNAVLLPHCTLHFCCMESI